MPNYGLSAIFKKRDVSMIDLSALTAYTGDEFAMFTRKGESPCNRKEMGKERVMTQLEKFQIKCKNNKEFQNAIVSYAKEHYLTIPEDVTYSFGIDFFDVRVDDKPVLIVCLPPVSNYKIYETEYTRKLLKSSHDITDAKLAVAVQINKNNNLKEPNSSFLLPNNKNGGNHGSPRQLRRNSFAPSLPIFVLS